MEVEWRWNGGGMEVEWRWNGNGMEVEACVMTDGD